MRKIGFIAMALVLALGAFGVGFAHWVDQVVITETVESGDVCIGLVGPLTLIDESNPADNGGYYPTSFPDYTCDVGILNVRTVSPPKNVAWGEAEYIDDDDDPYYERLKVTLHNVYPCYYNNVSFHVHNYGTIPVIMDSVTIEGSFPTVVVATDSCYAIDLNDNGHDDFEIRWGNHIGSQLDPGDDEWEISFGMHLIQDNEFPDDMQGKSYTFYIKLNFVQWNKYVAP